MPESKKQVILLLTNKSIDPIIELYDKLLNEVGDRFDVKFLFHNNEESVPQPILERDHFQFSNEDIYRKLGYSVLFDENFLNGNAHFPTFWFMQNNPDYDYYWLIEDDVIFTGNWNTFFDTIPDEYDYVTAYLKYFEDEPDWHWFNFFYKGNSDIPKKEFVLVGAFSPLYRLSNKAIKYANSKYLEGYRAHFELSISTLLYNGNFKLGDFGAESRFVMPGFINRFYRYNETYRYRPEQTNNVEEMLPNMLYHPVKYT